MQVRVLAATLSASWTISSEVESRAAVASSLQWTQSISSRLPQNLAQPGGKDHFTHSSRMEGLDTKARACPRHNQLAGVADQAGRPTDQS